MSSRGLLEGLSKDELLDIVECELDVFLKKLSNYGLNDDERIKHANKWIKNKLGDDR